MRVVQRTAGAAATTPAASSVPARATANVTSGAPPIAAYFSSGESPWPKASRAQGNPPNGNRSRHASSATHSVATHNGQPRRRVTRAVPSPSGASSAASTTASASHASTPTTRSQTSTGTKTPMPARSPYPKPPRTLRPRQTSVSAATPTIESGHASTGAKVPAMSAPAISAVSPRKTRARRCGRETWRAATCVVPTSTALSGKTGRVATLHASAHGTRARSPFGPASARWLRPRQPLSTGKPGPARVCHTARRSEAMPPAEPSQLDLAPGRGGPAPPTSVPSRSRCLVAPESSAHVSGRGKVTPGGRLVQPAVDLRERGVTAGQRHDRLRGKFSETTRSNDRRVVFVANFG